MLIRFTPENQQAIVNLLYIFLGVVVFLWGKAIGFNETAEAFKISDKKETVAKLRLEVIRLESENKDLILENENLNKWKKSVKRAVEV